MEHYRLFLGLAGDGAVHHINSATPGTYAGILTVGPIRFIDFLELHLGLAGNKPSQQQRILELKKGLDKVCNESAFSYKEPYQRDPLGVSERLLQLWDSWRLSGWKLTDEPMPPRMQMLFGYKDIFYHAGKGMADRIESLLYAIRKSNTVLPSIHITMVDDKKYFVPLFAELLDALPGKIHIEEPALTPQAPANSDLGKLQAVLSGKKEEHPADFFTNDGSFQLLYFPDDIQAATAMYTMIRKAAWKPLLINPDNSLLNGMSLSRGKPLCDWHSKGGNGQILQLFFLATALFKRPLQSIQLQGFLSSPYLPFSRRLAGKLLYAFCQKPGVNNADWDKAIEDYLQSIRGEPGEKKKIKAVNFWLKTSTHLQDNGYDTAFLNEIFSQLRSWALERAGFEKEETIAVPQLHQLVSVCDDLLSCLADEGERISPAKFERMQVRLFRKQSFAIANAETGCLDTVDTPGAVWVQQEEVLWMNATREEQTAVLSKHWFDGEKRYFKDKGLPVFDESSAYAAYLAGLRRMVLNTKKRLVFAIPSRYHGVIAYEPYCIAEWNQLIDCKKIAQKMDRLQAYVPWAETVGLLKSFNTIFLPSPKIYFNIPKKKYFRETESYTSLENLLQHPSSWFFNYILKLRHTAGLEVPATEQLMGLLADTMVQLLFSDANTTKDWWLQEALFEKKVLTTLNKVLETEGIPLLENVNRRQLVEFKKALVKNTACLRKLVVENNYEIVGTQVLVNGVIGGQPFAGPVDLILKKKQERFILDLKWTRSMKSYQDRLAKGRDLQLVIYRALMPSATQAAYFLLNNGNLLLRAEPPILEVTGPVTWWITPEEEEEEVRTIKILEKAINGLHFRMKEMSEGKLESAYHLPLETLEPSYYLEQLPANLYPLAEDKEGYKQQPYQQTLQVINGHIS